MRRQAREQAALERAQAGDVAAARATIARRRPVVRSAYEPWLDERDTARPLTRAELHSQSDDIAAAVVASGGGIEAIVEATDLRTRENVLRLIDPAILVRAFTNDAANAAGAGTRWVLGRACRGNAHQIPGSSRLVDRSYSR